MVGVSGRARAPSRPAGAGGAAAVAGSAPAGAGHLSCRISNEELHAAIDIALIAKCEALICFGATQRAVKLPLTLVHSIDQAFDSNPVLMFDLGPSPVLDFGPSFSLDSDPGSFLNSDPGLILILLCVALLE
ncbi:hypothetical protein EVAR_44764_1 [Eumeta japonica]|uniref:Uncharacterized protein n=1 Tax=Eumeta variegata TaxID=151549 RepID=A0A4C1XJ42_EUMVA|nr:hypothetical protein EVAR_44764_1 [Eumeta japonica]